MKLYPILLALFILTAIIAICLFAHELNAINSGESSYKIIPQYRTNGTVNFQVLTVTYHGQEAPKNIGAIWITTESGTFVKTLQRWGNSYLQYLTKWHSFTPTGNTTGAITSATLNSHVLHNLNWDCKNTSNVEVPDGNYKVWVEFIESQSTGPFTSVTFTKGPNAQHLTPANLANFQNMILDFTPTIVINAPTNLQAIVTGLSVNLSWSAPSSTVGCTGYKIYRDGSMLMMMTTPSTTSLIDTPPVGDHSYYVTAMFGSSESTASNTVNVSVTSNHDGTQMPDITYLNDNYPNPFNPETHISFTLAKNEYTSLTIYNTKGEKIKELQKGNLAAGVHVVSWNGVDDQGYKVASGIYFYQLVTKDKTLIKKMIMLK
jgi:hypothetical protein